MLIFKQEADAAALQALCVEAEAASQGRFSGRCTRLYTGTVMKGISGKQTRLRELDTGNQLKLRVAVELCKSRTNVVSSFSVCLQSACILQAFSACDVASKVYSHDDLPMESVCLQGPLLLQTYS